MKRAINITSAATKAFVGQGHDQDSLLDKNLPNGKIADHAYALMSVVFKHTLNHSPQIDFNV